MKKIFNTLTLCLIVLGLLAACAPAAPSRRRLPQPRRRIC